MPPKTQVIIFDDSSASVETVVEILASKGHNFIGCAGSIDALKINLPGWSSKLSDRQSTVALIDNHAPWFDGEDPDPKGVGRLAERMIKEAMEEAITVAITTENGDNVGYGDFRFDRINTDVDIGTFVTQLPAKER